MIIRTTGVETVRKVNLLNIEFVGGDCDYLHLILTTAQREIPEEEFPQAHVLINQLLEVYKSK